MIPTSANFRKWGANPGSEPYSLTRLSSVTTFVACKTTQTPSNDDYYYYYYCYCYCYCYYYYYYYYYYY